MLGKFYENAEGYWMFPRKLNTSIICGNDIDNSLISSIIKYVLYKRSVSSAGRASP
jgi:hypothetical protein